MTPVLQLARPSGHDRDLADAAALVGAGAAARAAAPDRDGAYPTEDVRLHGLLAARAPADQGGQGLGSDRLGSSPLLDVLRSVGRGSLPLGRLHEGHLSAWQPIAAHGDAGQRRRLAADARARHLFAVWNTEPAAGLRLDREGAGHLRRPVVTARTDAGAVRLVTVRLGGADAAAARADPASWRAQGTHASASGAFDLTGLRAEPGDPLGGPGGYEREPAFAAGARRFAAVQLGGIEALAGETAAHLRRTGRGTDPLQAARLGEIALAVEGARLWLERACRLAADAEADPEGTMAYVRLARLAVERAGLDVLERAHRSVGAQAFLRAHPVERIGRDLATYLRQPGPDRALVLAAEQVLAESGRRPAGFGPCRP